MEDALRAGSIAMQAVSGLAIAVNLLVLVVFARTRQLHGKYYAFFFNLALSDIALPAASIAYEYRRDKLILCLIWTSLYASAFNILAVAVNRLLALSITPPARYDVIVTRGRMVAACVIIWLVSAAIIVPTTYFESVTFSRLFRPLVVLTILLLNGVLYFVIFRKISRYSEPLASTEGARAVAKEHVLWGTRLRQIRHLMVTFTMILTASCVCWFPSCIMNLVIYRNGEMTPVLAMYLYYSYIAAVLNSAINPFIYWLRIPEGREGFYRLICCGRRSGQGEEESVNMQTMDEPDE